MPTSKIEVNVQGDREIIRDSTFPLPAFAVRLRRVPSRARRHRARPGLRPAQEAGRNQAGPSGSPVLRRPDTDEALAFLSVAELSALVRSRRLSSTELADEALPRPLKRFDRAEVRGHAEYRCCLRGRTPRSPQASYRGPLHGIPSPRPRGEEPRGPVGQSRGRRPLRRPWWLRHTSTRENSPFSDAMANLASMSENGETCGCGAVTLPS